jgi:hypothetical protein
VADPVSATVASSVIVESEFAHRNKPHETIRDTKRNYGFRNESR